MIIVSFADMIANLLLNKAEIDPNAKNNDGHTPLHMACRHRNKQLVKLLVRDERCNPHEKNSDGDTALHVACHHSSTYSRGEIHTQCTK